MPMPGGDPDPGTGDGADPRTSVRVGSPDNPSGRLCLVTGATGYVGGRLVPKLLEAGFTVRCMTRSRARLRDQPWADLVEIVEGDAARAPDARAAFEGVDVAYYLIHSMLDGPRFEEADRTAARVFATAAAEAGLGRLVYLGGLCPDEGPLSPHMRSRAEVGRILLDSGVPTAVLRAAVIIGSGSASSSARWPATSRPRPGAARTAGRGEPGLDSGVQEAGGRKQDSGG